MTASQPDRLDRIENLLERVVNLQFDQQNKLETQQGRLDRIETGIERFVDGQLGLQAQMGLLSEIVLEVRAETQQLKRAVDYLLSRDGERGSNGDRPQ
jgi:hypothetical protein